MIVWWGSNSVESSPKRRAPRLAVSQPGFASFGFVKSAQHVACLGFFSWGRYSGCHCPDLMVVICSGMASGKCQGWIWWCWGNMVERASVSRNLSSTISKMIWKCMVVQFSDFLKIFGRTKMACCPTVDNQCTSSSFPISQSQDHWSMNDGQKIVEVWLGFMWGVGGLFKRKFRPGP